VLGCDAMASTDRLRRDTLLLFPLTALAVARSVRGLEGVAAALCRVGMFVFAVSYVAFDTAAGVVTALLVQAAHATGNPEAWRAPVLAIWTHPVVGGAPGTTPVLAVAGTVAWLVGALAAAVAIRRAGASWMPVSLFAVAALGLFVSSRTRGRAGRCRSARRRPAPPGGAGSRRRWRDVTS
jgi:hypothetical protein